MNKLPFEKRRQILHLMCEGNSVRGIARLVDVSPVTVLRYLELAGAACREFHDAKVCNLNSKLVQCDEIWSFVFAKEVNAKQEMKIAGTAGSIWTWTALDADSKLIISYYIGNRDVHCANAFMHDVADRLANRVQLTTDGHRPYLTAIPDAFENEIDFGMLVKHYSETADRKGPERKYSPGVCTGARRVKISGNPIREHVSTSYAEKHNQSMRQHMRRFTRLTAAHSKKVANHEHMVALYTVWYNFVRINSAVKMAPAMAAGISSTLWEMDDLVRMVDEHENQWGRPKL